MPPASCSGSPSAREDSFARNPLDDSVVPLIILKNSGVLSAQQRLFRSVRRHESRLCACLCLLASAIVVVPAVGVVHLRACSLLSSWARVKAEGKTRATY